uniref:Uncharacterized LOC102233503 n=1 Tax=Xiphophorus maculatus TaxID=8083 RepID=A0A3B5QY66_XIPMA
MFLILIPRWIFLLLVAANIEAQQKPPINNTAIVVTPSIAAQCGFSMKSDSFGNALIYISLQNCFAQNVKRSMDAGFKATTVVFFTPEGEKPMSLLAAQQRGYGIGNTPTRLVLRSPMIAPETFIQTVNLSTALHMPKLKLLSVYALNRSCMDPMTSSGQFNLLEVHFGVNGQRLDAVEMQAREYSVALNDFYIVTELPIGGVGGYYESHIQGDLYYVSYMIEPMLELLWTEDATHEQTKYKVFFHITTHLLPQPLELIDVPPSVSGGCDNHNFYVLVKYGSPGYNFQTMVGKRYMTPSLAQHYDSMENGTHFSFVVPFSAPDVAVEAIEASSTRSRLDIVLSNPETNSQIQELSVACNFPSTLTECFPNGTMTALALKLESVPLLNPSQLTLADPSCGPVHSDDRYAFFVFTVNSCGTTRKFMTNAMLYENEISLPDELLMKKSPTSEEPEYHLKISCFYDINTSQTVAFNTRLRRSEPYAENSKGQLQVVMRLALDDSYSTFQNYEEYPIAKYLQQPLYFEVELLKSTNPLISLELENCWATQGKDRTSQPRWDLIINGCPNPADPYQVVFHPVWTDARVRYPSHFKRFEIQMFAFPNDILILQLFVHCDIVICDSKNPLGGICGGQCSNPKQTTKGEMDDFSFGMLQHSGDLICLRKD